MRSVLAWSCMDRSGQLQQVSHNASTSMTVLPPGQRTSLREIAALFLKLGVIGFEGSAAPIGMMEDKVASRRKWSERSSLLDLMGATNLIPRPNSTEMAIHIGHIRRGWQGSSAPVSLLS